MKRAWQIVAAAVMLATFEHPLRAQASSCVDRTVPISVLDDEPSVSPTISATDLTATVHGEPARILSITEDERPHRVVLLLDTSGSMRAHWPTTLSLAVTLFTKNMGSTQFALITFSTSVSSVVRFSDGNAAVEKRLQAMGTHDYAETIYGASAIRDGVESAARLFDQPTSADAIYLITDGHDNISKTDPGGLDRILVRTSIRLFVTIVSAWDNAGPIPQEDTSLNNLSTLALDSGGYVVGQIQWAGGKLVLAPDFDTDSTLSLNETFYRYFRAITQNQAMQMELPAPVNKRARLKLKFSRSARKRWKHARLVYPNFLASCSGS